MREKQDKKKVRNRKNILKKRIIKFCLITVIISILGLFSFIGSIYLGMFGELPTYNELENIKNDESSKIYTVDNKLIGKFFLQNRTNIGYNNISPHVFNALIATEDSRFYEHKGVDSKSLLRVLVKTIIMGDRSAGGGSTLSQQLAKNLFGRESHRFLSMPINKCKEMITASRLEKIYTKKEIITLYLNTVPFGEDVYGIESAAQRFFSKSAGDLAIIEAATLVGMLKASTAYNPRLHLERSTQRRNVVLNQMLKNNFITSIQAQNLKKVPLILRYKRLYNNSGTATYLRENLRQELKKIIKDYNLANGDEYNMYRDGLKIYTTIDSRLQKYAEEAVHEHIRSIQNTFYHHWGKREPWYKNRSVVTSAMKRSHRYISLKKAKKSSKEINKIFNTKVKMEVYSAYKGDKTVLMSPLDSVKHYLKILHTGFIAINPRNGQIKAWVGGIDHKYFKYDMIKAKRQTGSVFKPIVYAAALENGESPNSYYPNKRTVYKDYQDWSPRNSHNDKYEGFYSMKGALAQSINTVAVEVLMKTGFDKTISLAKSMGIEGELSRFPSLALGVSNSSLYEMVQVFSTFANNGEWNKPYYINKVTDKNGNILYENKETESSIVMASDNASIINYMLEGAVNEGTARRLRTTYGLKNCMAGKTGTTQNNADGWFIGYNPHIVAGARTGAEDMRVHFRSTYLGQGANTALPIFALFMKKALKDPNFAYWNDIQFPGISIQSAHNIDVPMFKKTLEEEDSGIMGKIKSIFKRKEKKVTEEKVKEEKKEEKPSIWKKIKNIFKKKKK